VAYTHGATGPARAIWWKRENLLPGFALVVLTVVAWGYTLAQGDAMHGMAGPAATSTLGSMGTPGTLEPARPLIQATDLGLFLFGWAVMMLAMMLPAALPLLLLYRTIARNRLRPLVAAGGIVALLAGYLGVWTLAGLPVYAYQLLTAVAGPILTVLPGLLLLAGGVYQFTALKQGCHTRCSNPLFFLMHTWRPGVTGAVRLGVLHGIDCLGCCAGLMLALVGLGMMHVAWMLMAAVIIFVEKTHPSGHRVARPLGLVLIVGGVVVLGASLLSSPMVM
jgi:predicted metal-binding membrane protein